MAPEQARDTRQATMASDVFSFGATMLFAATGHAPYQGETVMDVLVRLATEAPDLTGLPPELTGIVSACLQRDPRKRPDPAAVLAHLAPEADPFDGELGPSALPAPALALIAGYRTDPPPPGNGTGQAAAAGPDAGEETFGSHLGQAGPATGGYGLAVPGPAPPGPAAGERAVAEPGAAGPGRAGRGRAGQGRGGPGSRRAWLGLAAVAAAIALMAGGAVAGVVISRASRPAPATTAAASRPLGLPPGPPPGPPPFGQSSSRHAGRPAAVIAMSQPRGDGRTGFVVIGQGWPPGRPVTVTLAGVGKSPEHPVVDLAGSFSYLINQDHEFFPGGLPPGRYRVKITVPGAGQAVTSFLVDPVATPSPGAS
jgi:hypothetical protein